jgi:hypothetical protein
MAVEYLIQNGNSMSEGPSWTMATAEDDGKPLLLRIRNQPPTFARKDQFPHLLAVSWLYEPANEHGMPSDHEYTRMNELEELLEEALEQTEQAFLTVIVTGNAVREWQWYTRTPKRAMELVNEALGELEPFPVEFSIQDDPEWFGYERFMEISEDMEPGSGS